MTKSKMNLLDNNSIQATGTKTVLEKRMFQKAQLALCAKEKLCQKKANLWGLLQTQGCTQFLTQRCDVLATVCMCICVLWEEAGYHPAGLERLSLKRKEQRLLVTQAFSVMWMRVGWGEWPPPYTSCGVFPCSCLWEGIALGNILGVGG